MEYDDVLTDTVDTSHRIYNSVGKLVSQTGLASFIGFTGRPFEITVGFNYHWQRWYDPATSKWVSEDPLGFAAGDANLGRYVGNAATQATDPSGLRRRSGSQHGGSMSDLLNDLDDGSDAGMSSTVREINDTRENGRQTMMDLNNTFVGMTPAGTLQSIHEAVTGTDMYNRRLAPQERQLAVYDVAASAIPGAGRLLGMLGDAARNGGRATRGVARAADVGRTIPGPPPMRAPDPPAAPKPPCPPKEEAYGQLNLATTNVPDEGARHFAEYIAQRPDVDPQGVFDVTAHGSTDAIEIGGRAADPAYLADVIRHSPGYNGQPVRLISCLNGVGGVHSFAQELADNLGVVVSAAPGLVRVTDDGAWDIIGYTVINGRAFPRQDVILDMISFFPRFGS